MDPSIAILEGRHEHKTEPDAATGKRFIPSKACKATSPRNKLVRTNGRAPATTESRKAVKVSAGLMALGEVR